MKLLKLALASLLAIPAVANAADAPIKFETKFVRAADQKNGDGYAEAFLTGKKLQIKGYYNTYGSNVKTITLKGEGDQTICSLEPKYMSANMPGYGEMGKNGSTCELNDAQVAALKTGKATLELYMSHPTPYFAGTFGEKGKPAPKTPVPPPFVKPEAPTTKYSTKFTRAAEATNGDGYADLFLSADKKVKAKGYYNLVSWNAKSIVIKSGAETICTLEPRYSAANMPSYDPMGKGDSTCQLTDAQIAALNEGKVSMEVYNVKLEKPVLTGAFKK